MSRGRGEGGRFTSSVDDGDLLHFFEAGERPFYSAREVADEFDLDRTQAHRRLSQLEEDNELERVQVGSRNVVWWRPRDIAVLVPEEGGYSAFDPKTGVASQGENRPEALRMLAEAIEVSLGASEIDPNEIYEELGEDPDAIEDDAGPPWE